jgi:hypothetical protein
MMRDVAERKARAADKQNELESIIVRTSENIDNYLLFQKNECSELITKKNQCESIYATLLETAAKLYDTVTKLEKKLDYSAKALEYCGESDVLIMDINTSFKDAYNQNNEETMQNIERILSAINVLVFKYSSFQTFPKSYNDAISIYSAKMTSVLKLFEDNNTGENEQIKQICAEISDSLVEMKIKSFTLNSTALKYLNNNIHVRVNKIEVGNSNRRNEWIDKPGDKLYAEKIRYLNPVIYFDTKIDATIIVFIKIIKPDGTVYEDSVITNDGYSFFRKKYFSIGDNKKWDLDGF